MSAMFENTEDNVRVFCGDDHCSAMICGETRSIAVAEIDALGSPFKWWVARVLVSKPEDRGKGYGSQVLQAALKAIMEKTGGVGRVIVAPGGYDNDDRKFTFYVKNGFRQVVEERGIFEWRQIPGGR